jgi:hypothetical protein
METRPPRRTVTCALVVLISCLVWSACGDDVAGPEGTGATLHGTVTTFEAQVIAGGFALAGIGGVTVAIGSNSTETDANGDFTLRDMPLGNQDVLFSRDGTSGVYGLNGIDRGESFTIDQIQFIGGEITSAHTGTWVGTGGSTDSTSVGQIALTMILEKNGNAMTGTADVVGVRDATVWSISGSETGHSVDGSLTVVSTNSECGSGGAFQGTFVADTLSGTFVEVNPPAGCGPPENGTFRVVKQ